MSKVWVTFLAGLVRYALMGASGWLIREGIITEEINAELISGVVLAIATVLYMLWVKYKDRITVLTALQLPAGTSTSKLATEVSKDPIKPNNLLG